MTLLGEKSQQLEDTLGQDNAKSVLTTPVHQHSCLFYLFVNDLFSFIGKSDMQRAGETEATREPEWVQDSRAGCNTSWQVLGLSVSHVS